MKVPFTLESTTAAVEPMRPTEATHRHAAGHVGKAHQEACVEQLVPLPLGVVEVRRRVRGTGVVDGPRLGLLHHDDGQNYPVNGHRLAEHHRYQVLSGYPGRLDRRTKDAAARGEYATKDHKIVKKSRGVRTWKLRELRK